MKKRNKFYALLLTFSILFSCLSVITFANSSINNAFSTQSIDNFAQVIPVDINNYAIENYQSLLSVALEQSSLFAIEKNTLTNYKLGEPFVIYSVHSPTQPPAYHYPILNEQNIFQFTMTVILTTYGYQCSLDTELVNDLNQLDYYNCDYVFLNIGDVIYAQNRNNDVFFLNSMPLEDPLSTLNYSAKKNLISNIAQNMTIHDVDATIEYAKSHIVREMYSPGYAVNTSSDKRLALYNPAGQYGYGMCWASTVATIVNYLNGTSITGYNVCDIMNKGYNDGGTIFNSSSAFQKYGFTNYTITSGVLTWAKIQTNINNKKPAYMSTSGTDANGATVGHAVSLVGYREVGVNQFVIIWDSNTNSGSGGYKVIYFAGSNTTFQSTSTSPVFTWTETICVHY